MNDVYSDHVSSFEQLLRKEGGITFHQRNLQFLAIELFKTKFDEGNSTLKKIFVTKVKSLQEIELISKVEMQKQNLMEKIHWPSWAQKYGN